MYKNFFFTSKINFKKFLFYLPKRRNIILDYGCGNGVFLKENFKNKKIKLIKMIDKDKKLKKYKKKKYSKNKKIVWIDNLDTNYDVVFINSVIQYLSLNQYKNLLSLFLKKKVKLILISDIPKYPRMLEAMLLMFFDPIKLLKGINYLFQGKYLKTDYFYKNYNELIIDNKSYIFIKKKNLNEDKLLRYSLLIKRIR